MHIPEYLNEEMIIKVKETDKWQGQSHRGSNGKKVKILMLSKLGYWIRSRWLRVAGVKEEQAC